MKEKNWELLVFYSLLGVKRYTQKPRLSLPLIQKTLINWKR